MNTAEIIEKMEQEVRAKRVEMALTVYGIVDRAWTAYDGTALQKTEVLRVIDGLASYLEREASGTGIEQ